MQQNYSLVDKYKTIVFYSCAMFDTKTQQLIVKMCLQTIRNISKQTFPSTFFPKNNQIVNIDNKRIK